MEELQVAGIQVPAEVQLQLKTFISKIQQGCIVDNQGRVRALVNAREALLALGTYTTEQLIDNPTEGLIMPIDYVDNCPVIDGIPIWEKLPGETLEAFDLFNKYILMKQLDSPQRSVYKLSLSTKEEIPRLEALRLMYHWGLRAQAYDDYVIGNRVALMEMRRMDIEDRHAKAGRDLVNLSLEYISGHKEMLTPKVAIQLLDLATKLERQSVGLSGGRDAADSRINVNVANTIGTPAAVVENTTVTGDISQDRERLMKVLNIMNTVGVFPEKDPVIVAEVVEE